MDVEVNNAIDPPQTVTTLSPEGGFMFAIFISGVDFEDNAQRIFDVTMLEQDATALDGAV